MKPKAAVILLPLLVFLSLFSGSQTDASGASPAIPPVAFTVLHTANGLGEVSPCG